MIGTRALPLTLFLVLSLCTMPCGHAENEQPKPALATAETTIPTIEALASEWLDVSQITQMPSLHNFHEMAACAPDLLAVNYIPGRRLFVYPVTTRWYEYETIPVVKLRINGQAYDSTSCRWYPYQAVRRRSIDDLDVETKVRMVFEGPGILYRVHVTSKSPKSQSVDLAIEVPGDKDDPLDGLSVATASADPKMSIVHAFRQQPDRVEAVDGAVTATWRPTLRAGESITVELVMAHSLEEAPTPAPAVAKQARDWAKNFDNVWRATKTDWGQRWSDAFTPGNQHFSGSLPTLVTADEKISDIYYRSILTLLVLHRTNLNMNDRVFITSGEREKGFVFYWDTSMWSKISRCLNPQA